MFEKISRRIPTAFRRGSGGSTQPLDMVYHACYRYGIETRKTKHVTYAIGYHFVWCPKYRKNILAGDIASFAEAEIRRLCDGNGWTIGSLSLQEDHVHLFLSAPPAVSPSQIANTLKGITARQIFKHFPDVKQHLGGGSFWSRSFYVGTVGAMSEEVVKNYLERG